MGVKEYNILFNVFFWIKTLLALCCGFGGLGYFGYEIYDLRLKSIGTPFIDFGRSISSDLSTLEPPSPYVYVGFSIDWRVRDPSKIKLDGKKPLI